MIALAPLILLGCNPSEVASTPEPGAGGVIEDRPIVDSGEAAEPPSERYEVGQEVPVGSNDSFTYRVISWEGPSASITFDDKEVFAEPGNEFIVVTLAYSNHLKMGMDVSIPSNFILKDSEDTLVQPRVLNIVREDASAVFNGTSVDLFMFSNRLEGESTLEKSLVYELPSGTSGLRLVFGTINRQDDRYVFLR